MINWKLMATALAICIAASLVAVACGQQATPVSPISPVPTHNIEVKVVQGIEYTAASANIRALDDECAKVPLMDDVRAADDPSLSILPRLGPNDYATAQAWAGFAIRDEYGCRRAQAGQKYLDVAAIELKCGPAVLQAQVKELDGSPFDGYLVFLNWPGAEQFPSPVDPPYYQAGVGGFTDGGGSVGFGFGPGSQLTPGSGGPFNVWGSSDPSTWTDRVVGSDMLAKVGWFDNHCVFNPIFQVVRKGGVEPIPPIEGHKLVDFDENGNITGYMYFQTDTPPAGRRYMGLYDGDTQMGWLEWMDEQPN